MKHSDFRSLRLTVTKRIQTSLRLAALLAVPGISIFTSLSLQAAPANDAAVAEALFQKAQQLMKQGRATEACPKFAESHRIDPATGTLLNLAVCHEAEGKLATAWAELNEVVTRARIDLRPDRESYARERIAALEPRLARLTIAVDRGKQPRELAVELDGVSIGPAAWGVATPIDPGVHEVRAAARGKRVWSTRIQVGAVGQRLTVVVPPLDDEHAAAPPSSPALANGSAPADAAATAGAGPGRWSARRTAGVAIASVGAASLAVGSIFGVRAFSRWSEAEKKCPMEVCTTPADDRASKQASAAATVANVGFGVGLAAAAVGLYLFFSSPQGEPPQAQARAKRAGFSLDLVPVIDVVNPGVGVACGF